MPHTADNETPVVLARPLTHAAFSPFGHVARPGSGDIKTIREGEVRLSKSASIFTNTADAPRAALDFYEVQPTFATLRATTIERHPKSTQMFCPMGSQKWLVAVWPKGSDGPVEAFVAGPMDVVTYKAGIWHHGIVAIDHPACFSSLMWKSPDGAGDTEFVTLPAPVTIGWDAV